MSRRRRARAFVAALVAMLLAGAYAAPSVSAAGLRAAKCCAEHCEKPRSPAAARSCCPSLGATDDVGAFAVSARTTGDPGPAASVVVLELPAVDTGVSPRMPLAGVSPRVAPVFLRTLSLRL